MIGEPDTEGREQILKIHTEDSPLAPDVSLRELAEITEGFVGSDLESIAREAAIEALREDEEADVVGMSHFRKAMENVRPTITDDIREYYERMEEDFKGGGPEPAQRGRSGGRIGFQ
jgi:transitional endoplasmic reticulum ATPase